MRYQLLFKASYSKNSKRNATTGPHPQHEVHKKYQSRGCQRRQLRGRGGGCAPHGAKRPHLCIVVVIYNKYCHKGSRVHRELGQLTVHIICVQAIHVLY